MWHRNDADICNKGPVFERVLCDTIKPIPSVYPRCFNFRKKTPTNPVNACFTIKAPYSNN